MDGYRRIEKLEGVGDRLRAARVAKGWTIRELSKRANVWPNYITRAETEYHSISLALVARLAETLEVSIDELVYPPEAVKPKQTRGVMSIHRQTMAVHMQVDFEDGLRVHTIMTVGDFGFVLTGVKDVGVAGRIQMVKRKPKGLEE